MCFHQHSSGHMELESGFSFIRWVKSVYNILKLICRYPWGRSHFGYYFVCMKNVSSVKVKVKT